MEKLQFAQPDGDQTIHQFWLEQQTVGISLGKKFLAR